VADQGQPTGGDEEPAEGFLNGARLPSRLRRGSWLSVYLGGSAQFPWRFRVRLTPLWCATTHHHCYKDSERYHLRPSQCGRQPPGLEWHSAIARGERRGRLLRLNEYPGPRKGRACGRWIWGLGKAEHGTQPPHSPGGNLQSAPGDVRRVTSAAPNRHNVNALRKNRLTGLRNCPTVFP
jgi:hypothetical protein